jgi:hypothetical protein
MITLYSERPTKPINALRRERAEAPLIRSRQRLLRAITAELSVSIVVP